MLVPALYFPVRRSLLQEDSPGKEGTSAILTELTELAELMWHLWTDYCDIAFFQTTWNETSSFVFLLCYLDLGIINYGV